MANHLLTMKNSFTSSLTFLFIVLFIFIPRLSLGGQMPAFARLQPIISSITAAIDVATDQSGRLYVAESANDSVVIFNENGQYAATLTGLSHPLCVDVDAAGRMYIGNKDAANVEVYDPGFNLLFKLGEKNGEFVQPNDLAIAATGQIYVVDQGADIVKIYNTDGTLSSSFGGSGNEEGQFHRPVSIAIDEGAAELVVLDHQLSLTRTGKWIDGARIQIFDMNGVFKRGFTKFGISAKDLFKPQRMIVDDKGGLYITDSYHNVVFVYDSSDGVFLGTVYNLENPLRTPTGITLWGNLLYVATRETGTVEVYQIDHGGQAASANSSVTHNTNDMMTTSEKGLIKESITITPATTGMMQIPTRRIVPDGSIFTDKVLSTTDIESSDSEKSEAEFPWPLFKHLLMPAQ